MDKLVHFSTLNLNIYCETEVEITKRIETFAEDGIKTGLALHFAAASVFVESSKSEKLLKILRQGIVYCDSRPMFWYLRSQAKRRVQLSQSRGTGYMSYVWNKGTQIPFRHFLIAPDEETANKLERQFIANGVNGKVVGHLVPTFTNDIQSLFDQSIFPIMESKAEVIWIGIGAPKQIVLANRLCETLPIIALSVGAAFEIVSGTKFQAPKVFQRFGMEWLFRWIQEPRRLLGRYTIGNVRFLKILADDIFKRAKLKWKNL